MYLRSPCKDSEGGLGISKWGLPRRGDSGGGVSQPISDTGEPFFTYGVASRMYFTGTKKKRVSWGSQHYLEYLNYSTFSQSLHLSFFDGKKTTKKKNSIGRRTQRDQQLCELIFHHIRALGFSQSEMKAGNPYANHFTPTAVLNEEINSPHICILSYCISRRLLLVLDDFMTGQWTWGWSICTWTCW